MCLTRFRKNIPLRSHQENADNAIDTAFLADKNGVLVKMFCGTGKSRVMLYNSLQHDFIVFVFPTLQLISQFNEDYLKKFLNNEVPTMSVCSMKEHNEDSGFTTDEIKIKSFMRKYNQKIICVTYQSYETLINCMSAVDIFPDITNFDEAHHASEKNTEHLIFKDDVKGKLVFYTATPNKKLKDCIPIAFNYTYLDGLKEGLLKKLSLYIDLSSKDENVYSKIARSILKTGNNRVLMYHAQAKTEKETSVVNLVDQNKFRVAFEEVLQNEFNNQSKYTKEKIRFQGITENNIKFRNKILKDFNTASNDEISILSSCRTISEGTDTTNANMCVFIDPKKSVSLIIQNFGRVVRNPDESDIPATILIPISIHTEEYKQSNTEEDRDEIIRKQLNESGDYEGILNVMSALQQEDEEFFESCLNYSKTFTDKQMRNNFEDQGVEFDNDKSLSEDEFKQEIQENPNIRYEIHTSYADEPVYFENLNDTDKKVTRKYWKDNENTYHPMTEESTKDKVVKPPQTPSDNQNRLLNFHISDELKVLWKIDDSDLFGHFLCGEIKFKLQIGNREDNAIKNIKSLISFYDIHERSPSEKNENEKFLWKWKDSYKNRAKLKYDSVNQLIKNCDHDELIAYFFGDAHEFYHMQRAKKYIEYCETNNERPKNKHKLAEWARGYKLGKINKKNNTLGMRFENVNELLLNCGNNICSKYFQVKLNSDEDRMKKAIKLEEWVCINNRFPQQTNDDNEEDTLRTWAANMKGSKFKVLEYLKNSKYKHVSNFFNMNMTTIDGREKMFLQKAKNLHEFCNSNNRFPQKTSLNKEERTLYYWASDYKNKRGMHYPTVNQYLKECNNKLVVDYFFIYNASLDNLVPKPSNQIENAKRKNDEKRGRESSETDSSNLEEEDPPPQPKQPRKTCCEHMFSVTSEDDVKYYEKCTKCGQKRTRSRCTKSKKYNEPNPKKKLEINTWLSEQEFLPGKAILLDAEGMKSSKSLYSANKFGADNIIIPEYDFETYEKNREDHDLGQCMRNDFFLEELKKTDPEDLSLIYADFTGQFNTVVAPLLYYLESKTIRPGTILGVTWSDNGAKGLANRMKYQNLKRLGVFEDKGGWEPIEDEDSPAQYEYDTLRNMNVVFFRKN